MPSRGRRPPIRIQRPEKGFRTLTFLWGPVYWGVQIALSQTRWWFIGRTDPRYKKAGW